MDTGRAALSARKHHAGDARVARPGASATASTDTERAARDAGSALAGNHFTGVNGYG